jgi:hypothetical protein
MQFTGNAVFYTDVGLSVLNQQLLRGLPPQRLGHPCRVCRGVTSASAEVTTSAQEHLAKGHRLAEFWRAEPAHTTSLTAGAGHANCSLHDSVVWKMEDPNA